jgi:hypothetical protein
MGVTKMSEEPIEQRLKKIMDTPYTKEKVSNMAKKHDVPFGVAETMFKSTLRQMLADKNTDWSKFEVVED